MASSNDRRHNEALHEDYDWVKIKSEIDNSRKAEYKGNKFIQLLRKNPFVPAGMLSTCIVLGLGFRSFVKDNKKNQQFYMRARVAAQGFTVFAMVGTVVMELLQS